MFFNFEGESEHEKVVSCFIKALVLRMAQTHHNCHEKPEEYDTISKITKDMMDMIPETIEAMTKVDNNNTNNEQFKDAPTEDPNNDGSEEEEEIYQEEEEYQEGDYYQQGYGQEEYGEGDVYQQGYNEEEYQEGEEEKEEEIGFQSQFKRPISDDEPNLSKKKRKSKYPTNGEYQYQYNSSSSTVPPPPLPTLPSNDEALSNLIMAWYYSGYYTGLYQAQQQQRR
ncbi:hypothetical protein K501DRAFT_337790 [Backusella circina FSU 941]|nr:hypothetical protein K501DRAFT_338777 [Backusella circina FSU 941]KAI8876904.1 hypothetical protein K501DRAFT_337790 [Backusella circina FSU 941]